MVSKKKLSVLAGAAVLMGGALVPAGATTLYEHANYTGFAFDAPASNNMGLMNDKASSARAYGKLTHYYDHAGYKGHIFSSSSDYNYLGAMGAENRISSYRHADVW